MMSDVHDDRGSMVATKAFAARYAHPGWGWALVIFGGVFALGNLVTLLVGIALIAGSGPAGSPTDSAPAGSALTVISIVAFLVNLGLVAWGIYLIRGVGETPAAARRRWAIEQRQAAEAQRLQQAAAQRAVQAQAEITAAAAAVVAASGGAALVAYRRLEATAQRWYPHDFHAQVTQALSSAGFDMQKLDSPRYGYLATLRPGVTIEIFRDWIIRGEEAHDVDASTQGFVHTEGTIQFSQTHDLNNRTIESQHDLRVAELQLIGNGWSLSDRIHPDDTIAAKKLIAELASHVETLKARSLTPADLKAMVDAILNSTGQPPAEKLKQLSNLRFDRLLSDEEYEQAKAKILGVI